MSLTTRAALPFLRSGAVIGNGPQGAWLTERGGTTHNLHANTFWSLRRRGLLRRVEPPGRFYAVCHYTLRDQTGAPPVAPSLPA